MNPRTTLASTLRWWAWLALGQWRAAPARAAVSVCAVAIGVALVSSGWLRSLNVTSIDDDREQRSEPCTT